MKRILFLLLLTVSVYGQNPSRFAKIQITGNTNSGTATKVNVQETNGEVNTQAINTAFNKNFGLNSGDVIGADNLLNQYSTVPSNWVAQAYTLGSVVFYAGKQWYASAATVAGDVPNVSSKWTDITFEALNNNLSAKANLSGGNSFTGNQQITGNISATGLATISGNVVGDGFIKTGGTANQFLKADGSVDSNIYAPLASPSFTGTPTAPTATAGTNTTQLATTAFVTNGLNGKFDTPTGLTTNFLPKWNGSAFGNSSITENAGFVAIGSSTIVSTNSTDGFVISNATDSNKQLIIGYDSTNNQSRIQSIQQGTSTRALLLNPIGGQVLVGTTTDNGVDTVQVNGSGRFTNLSLALAGYIGYSPTAAFYPEDNVQGAKIVTPGGFRVESAGAVFNSTIQASPATTANQVVVKSQLDAAARPYKVYVALLNQTGTNAPTATVLENTLGTTATWTRFGVGIYDLTLSTGSFTGNKTIINISNGDINTWYSYGNPQTNVASVRIVTSDKNTSNPPTDSRLTNTFIEIRVYL